MVPSSISKQVVDKPKNSGDLEIQTFFELLEKGPKVHPIRKCFITGRACVQGAEDAAPTPSEPECGEIERNGFVIAPFQPNLRAFLELDLRRYVNHHYRYETEHGCKSVKISRADDEDNSSNGYIVCKRICRRLHSSDFVIADISIGNPNVLYELGLAYGMSKKLIVTYQSGSKFGEAIHSYLSGDKRRIFSYQNFTPLDKETFPLSKYLWNIPGKTGSIIRQRSTHAQAGSFSHKSPILTILDTEGSDTTAAESFRHRDGQSAPTAHQSSRSFNGKSASLDSGGYPLAATAASFVDFFDESDISVDSTQHIQAAVGVSIDEILVHLQNEQRVMYDQYKDAIGNLRTANVILHTARFEDIESRLRDTYFAIIKIGPRCAPMAYFWVGFCHAIGINVIPILIKDTVSQAVRDTAFDTQPLWQITFCRERPTEVQKDLQDILKDIIQSDFKRWSRTRFWNQLCVDGSRIAIVAGMPLFKQLPRDVVGAYDLLTIAKLTEYLESHGLKTRITSPIDQAKWQVNDVRQFVNELKKQPTWIIVGSALVNPAADFVLSRQHKRQRKIHSIKRLQTNEIKDCASESCSAMEEAKRLAATQPGMVVAFKHAFKNDTELKPEAYRISTIMGGVEVRGFASTILPSMIIQSEKGDARHHAQLLLMRNRYYKGGEGYLVVLNGISGEATYALALLLTQRNESAIARIVENWNDARSLGYEGVQYIFEFEISSPDNGDLQKVIKSAAETPKREFCGYLGKRA